MSSDSIRRNRPRFAVKLKRRRAVSGGIVKRPRMYLAALPIGILLMLAARTEPASSSVTQPAAMLVPQLRYDALAVAAPAELPEHSVVLTFEANDTLDAVFTLRRGLSQMPPQSAMEWLIKRIAATPSNDQLLSGL